MDKQQLRDRLQQLHQELQQVETVDAQDREELQKLGADIRKLLDSQEDHQANPDEGFVERLREGIERFEAKHPDLTLMMGQLADMLARMGI
jgi:hypothetical protein